MNLKLAIFGLLIAGIFLADQAHAQTYGNKLRGVNQFGLLTEDLDEDAKECQITEALIRDAFMYPASGARFVVRESPSGRPYVYFGITTILINQRRLCVSNVLLSLRVNQEVKLEASGRNIVGRIELWMSGLIHSSAKGRNGQTVRSQIEELTKKFITDWNLDNK